MYQEKKVERNLACYKQLSKCDLKINRHVPKQLFILSSKTKGFVYLQFFLAYFLFMSCKTLVYMLIIVYD